jgi:hypothetical protein
MGQWIEFQKERRRDPDQDNQNIDHNLTFKRTLHGLQNGGVYGPNGLHNTMGPAAANNRGDTIS